MLKSISVSVENKLHLERPKRVKRGRPNILNRSREEPMKEAKKRYTESQPHNNRDDIRSYTDWHPEVNRAAVGRYVQSHPEVHRVDVERFSQQHPKINRSAV